MSITHNILHRDGAKKVYNSPAMADQYLYFTNKGDDIANQIIGNGKKFFLENINSDSELSVNVQFIEDILIKDAYFFWENAKWGDTVSIEIVLPKNTLFKSPTNTGNVNVIDNVPTPVTTSQIPDETWTGTHLYFPIDVSIVRFVNDFTLIGTNHVGTILESTGVALVNKELQIKLILKSETKNPDLKMSVNAELYRVRTI